MSRAARLAWSIWALCFALTGAGLAFLALDLHAPVKGYLAFGSGSRASDAVLALPLLALPTVGALIASRRPENPIGWIFCGAGLVLGVSNIASEYAVRTLFVDPGSLPQGEAMAGISIWLLAPGLFLAGTLLLLLFPDGRPPSRRWRPVAWLAIASIAVLTLAGALAPGRLPDDPFKSVENPFGIEGAKGVFDALEFVWLPFMMSFVASGAALVLRFRRARGREREQLKWFASAGALFVLSFVGNSFAYGTSQAATEVTEVLTIVAVTGIPVSAGVAILKYRLYEIDLIIRRTLVYGSLTASLAAAYFGIVLALQEALGPITQGSDLAIAGSTLAVAALFRPARRRIQTLVDRRFYRRKFDATQTLEAFSARLRREIDLDSLSAELRAVVEKTMQPEHVSLWLRLPKASR